LQDICIFVIILQEVCQNLIGIGNYRINITDCKMMFFSYSCTWWKNWCNKYWSGATSTSAI